MSLWLKVNIGYCVLWYMLSCIFFCFLKFKGSYSTIEKNYKAIQWNSSNVIRLSVLCYQKKDFITFSNLCKIIRSVLVYFYIALNYSCSFCFNLFQRRFVLKHFQWLYPKTKLVCSFETNTPLVCTQHKFLLLMLKKFLICYHFLALMLYFYVNSSSSVTLVMEL